MLSRIAFLGWLDLLLPSMVDVFAEAPVAPAGGVGVIL